MQEYIVRYFRQAKKLTRLVRDIQYILALLKGVAAAVEHTAVLRALAVRTVVDIGANKGQFSLVASSVLTDAKIIAIEPLPEAAAKLRDLFAEDVRITVHEVAIGPSSGTAKLHVSKQDDSSSLLEISNLQERVFPGTGLLRTVEVPTCRLNDILDKETIEKPALLKLDVQGYELEALQSCTELLSDFNYVYAECSFIELYCGQAMARDVIRFLCGRGFEIEGVYNLVCDDKGRAVQADFLFIRSAT